MTTTEQPSQSSLRLLSLDEAITLAKEVVQEKGEDYVYINPSGEKAGSGSLLRCENWDIPKDQPSCIVGTILYRSGVVGKSDLTQRNTSNAEAFEGCYVDESVNLFLTTLQDAQDDGMPYGEALNNALVVVERRNNDRVNY